MKALRPLLGTPEFALAAAYVGAVVGAGFATGREILQFFAVYGQVGLTGAVLAGLALGVAGGMLLHLVKRNQISDYTGLLRLLLPPALVSIFDLLTTALLFLGLVVVLAGAGALTGEHWSSSPWLGSLVLAVLLIPCLLADLQGMLIVNNLLAPALALVTTALAATRLAILGWPTHVPALPSHWLHPSWGLSAFLYVAYNLFLGATVITGLGAVAQRARRPMLAGLLAGSALALMATLLSALLLAALPDIARYQVPVASEAAALGDLWSIGYQFALTAALLTTGLANGFGLQARWGHRSGVWLVVLALPFSQLGLAHLVRSVYPVAGMIGSLFLLLVTARFFKR